MKDVKMTQMKKKTFCATYVPMAKAGKSALEIGRSLGLVGDDKVISQKVSQKASILRKELKVEALSRANKDNLGTEATSTLIDQCMELMPKLTTRTREKMESFSDFLKQMIEEIN